MVQITSVTSAIPYHLPFTAALIIDYAPFFATKAKRFQPGFRTSSSRKTSSIKSVESSLYFTASFIASRKACPKEKK